MSFSVAIIGLPNAGKSTLFKALTKLQTRIEPRPFTTIEPNVGVVPVPDNRLSEIANVIEPDKIKHASIEFWDIAGLVKGAHEGQGLGNQFLGQIRNCHILVEIIRGFPHKTVFHVEGELNIERDRELIQTELIMKDLESVEKALQKEESSLLKKIKEHLENGEPVRKISLNSEQKEEIRDFQLLTQKPIISLLNDDSPSNDFDLTLDLKFEEELSEMEIEIESELPKLISACYQKLGLITFYTVRGGKEVSAWPLKKGLTAPQAGGVVHSDFEAGFIKAEVVNWSRLVESGGWPEAKERGQIKTVGKDYVLQDGDVIEFKHATIRT